MIRRSYLLLIEAEADAVLSACGAEQSVRRLRRLAHSRMHVRVH